MRHIMPRAILLIAALLLCTALAAPAAAVTLVDENLYHSTDTSAVDGPYSNNYDRTCTFNTLYLPSIEKRQELSYIGMTFPGNVVSATTLVEGENDLSYTLYGVTKTCRIYVSFEKNYAGSITKTRLLFFFDDWDIGTHTGTGVITFSKTVMSCAAKENGLHSPNAYFYQIVSYYAHFPQSVTTNIASYQEWKNHLVVESDSTSYIVNLYRNIESKSYPSTINLKHDGSTIFFNAYSSDFSATYLKSQIDSVQIITTDYDQTWDMDSLAGETPTVNLQFTLSLSPDTVVVGDTLNVTLSPSGGFTQVYWYKDGIFSGWTYDGLLTTYATGEVGKTYAIYADIYLDNEKIATTPEVFYTITAYPEEPDQYTITGVSSTYNQDSTISGSIDDSGKIYEADEIWWVIVPQSGEITTSKVIGARYRWKDIGTGWQKDDGSGYEGNYTYSDAKTLSHQIRGYGAFDVAIQVYNRTQGLIDTDRVSSYSNPASYYKPVDVYIYGNSGLYNGYVDLSVKYIVQDKTDVYHIESGFATITVVKAGDYEITCDVDDNSVYKDKTFYYSYDSDGARINIFLDEDFTISEHAKLTVRVVDIDNNPLPFANVKFVGLAQSTMTTNANGYAEYIGENNETVTFTASKSGYLSGEGTVKLTESINTYMLVLPLLTDSITPTDTPTTPTGTDSPITNFINLIMSYGMSEDMAKLVLGLIISGGLFAIGVKFGESVGAGLAGAVLGIIFSCALNLIPMWIIVAIILCAAAILASKLYGQG